MYLETIQQLQIKHFYSDRFSFVSQAMVTYLEMTRFLFLKGYINYEKHFVCFSLIHCINSITFNRPDQNYILSCRLFIRKYPTVQYVSQHWITMKTIEDCPPPDPSCCCPAHMSFIKLVFRPLRTSQLGNTPFVLCADLHTRRKYFPVRLLWKITTLSPCFCIDFFF